MMISGEVINVGRENLHQELKRIAQLRRFLNYNHVFIDTEFPGVIHRTSPFAPEDVRYSSLKMNVDSTKLIQFGVSVCNAQGSNCFSWQFNLSDFDPMMDRHSTESIEFLKKNGMDFDLLHAQGVESTLLSALLPNVLINNNGCKVTKWITYHGLYDVAYLLKLILRKPLPDTLPDFLQLVQKHLGSVYDIKYMLQQVDGSYDRMGLEKVARALGIDWRGNLHQAGHDSFLTAKVFWEMKTRFGLDEDNYSGLLYGVNKEGIKQKMYPLSIRVGLKQKMHPSPNKIDHQEGLLSKRDYLHVRGMSYYSSVFPQGRFYLVPIRKTAGFWPIPALNAGLV